MNIFNCALFWVEFFISQVPSALKMIVFWQLLVGRYKYAFHQDEQAVRGSFLSNYKS
jgi:hypothetical protein